MADQLLKIGELAAQAGVTVQTLHYYERLGLLPKAQRSASGHRCYSSEDLRRLEFIKKAQALGFTLGQIKEIFFLRKSRNARCRRVMEIAAERLREIDDQLAVLQAFRQTLAAALPQWAKTAAARPDCCGEFCDLIEETRPSLLNASFRFLDNFGGMKGRAADVIPEG